ncbi:hypothetical protein ACFQZZ_26445 [Nocardia sp. GCM10030253]|uniref:hypothetical protein n=1 Tax=Nocardia sp. GCM10030253 TaxID=3273404 RepID=UPI0036306504
MTTRRITLTLPEELVATAEYAVAAGHASSVSAYIADAAEVGRARAPFAEMMPNTKSTRPVGAWLAGVMQGKRQRDARSVV